MLDIAHVHNENNIPLDDVALTLHINVCEVSNYHFQFFYLYISHILWKLGNLHMGWFELI